MLLSKNVVEEVKKLKEEDGRDIEVWGSSNLIQTLLKHNLIDEFWLKIYPITLGIGKRLFNEGTIPVAYKLTSSKVSPKGVIFVTYERVSGISV